jgi:hypothetical protein
VGAVSSWGRLIDSLLGESYRLGNASTRYAADRPSRRQPPESWNPRTEVMIRRAVVLPL